MQQRAVAQGELVSRIESTTADACTMTKPKANTVAGYWQQATRRTWFLKLIWDQVSKPRHTRPAPRPMMGPTVGTSMTARSAGNGRGRGGRAGRGRCLSCCLPGRLH
jgi:hypothetical protein